MHIWISLAAREAALLAILLLLGSGPASFLSSRFDAAGRIGLAPALGFCLGTCVTTTLLQFAPTNSTYWILAPLALASAATATIRTWPSRQRTNWRMRLPVRDLAALVLVGAVVTGPLNAVLHRHHTVGPGAFYFTDVDNYVAVQDAARTVSLHAAKQRWTVISRSGAPGRDFTQYTWSFFAQFGSNLDATPLDSNVNALLGLSAVDTFAPFLSVLLLMGGLGGFVAVRYYSRTRTVVAALAGCLFGGALFLELWFDTFQAAIIGIGLLIPAWLLIDQTLESRRPADLVLLALVMATFLSVYPLYVPLLVVTAALILLWRGFRVRTAGGSLASVWRPVVVSVLGIAAMSLVFDPVAVARDVHYFHLLAHNEVPLPRVGYKLPIPVLPGWIAQTREFWALSGLWSGGLKPIVWGVILPLLFLALIVVGLRRYPAALALVVLAGVAAAVAEYTYLSQQSCTYCAERDLLTLAPIVAVLIALGLCALLTLPGWWPRLAAIGGVLVVVAGATQRTRIELTRFSDQSFFFASADRKLMDSLPVGSGRVHLEGFGLSLGGQAEQPLMYHYVNYRAPGRASIIAGTDVNNSIQYLDFGAVRLPPGPEFDPSYRYVLTRLSGVATSRRVIATRSGAALEERVRPLDVTPYAGLSLPLQQLDPSGAAFVDTRSPLQMYVVGRNGGRPAWVRLTFAASVPVSVPAQPGVRWARHGATLSVCVRATGPEPLRTASVALSAALVPGAGPPAMYPPAMPAEGLRLTAMHAVTGRCLA